MFDFVFVDLYLIYYITKLYFAMARKRKYAEVPLKKNTKLCRNLKKVKSTKDVATKFNLPGRK